MENGTNGKRTFVFLGQQTINGIQDWLVQQTHPSMPAPLILTNWVAATASLKTRDLRYILIRKPHSLPPSEEIFPPVAKGQNVLLARRFWLYLSPFALFFFQDSLFLSSFFFHIFLFPLPSFPYFFRPNDVGVKSGGGGIIQHINSCSQQTIIFYDFQTISFCQKLSEMSSIEDWVRPINRLSRDMSCHQNSEPIFLSS
jgi:hypothetical protein